MAYHRAASRVGGCNRSETTIIGLNLRRTKLCYLSPKLRFSSLVVKFVRLSFRPVGNRTSRQQRVLSMLTASYKFSRGSEMFGCSARFPASGHFPHAISVLPFAPLPAGWSLLPTPGRPRRSTGRAEQSRCTARRAGHGKVCSRNRGGVLEVRRAPNPLKGCPRYGSKRCRSEFSTWLKKMSIGILHNVLEICCAEFRRRPNSPESCCGRFLRPLNSQARRLASTTQTLPWLCADRASPTRRQKPAISLSSSGQKTTCRAGLS